MNARLKDAMDEQAWRAAQAPVDLGPVIAAGNRRRRVRGLAGAGVAGVVAAAVVFGGVQIAGTSDGAESAPYATPGEVTARAATYASGSTIHYGDEEIETGKQIGALVQTGDGFVFMGAGGKVWFADGRAQRKIGENDGGKSNSPSRLVADESGSYVAWADASAQEYVVYDTASRAVALRVPSLPDAGGGPYVYAIDGANIYVLDRRGLSRIDIQSGEAEVLNDDIRYRTEVRDVEDGLILRQGNFAAVDGKSEGGEIPLAAVLSRDPMADGPLTAAGALELSPDGRFVTTDFNDSEQIVDTRTNEEVVLDTSQYGFQGLIRWLDDDTVALGVIENPDLPDSELEMSLLSCGIPSGECTVVADDLPPDVTFPIGGDRAPHY